jgi:very-short-patch-repair endonuclease
MAKLRGGDMHAIYFGATAELLRLAAELRHSMTPAESILWNALRTKQLGGFKFRRQHPINQIIVDFYCHEARLSIEVNGAVHNNPYQKERDEGRTFLLNQFGIRELCFTNFEVENQLESVLDKIETHLQSLPPAGGRAGDGG